MLNGDREIIAGGKKRSFFLGRKHFYVLFLAIYFVPTFLCFFIPNLESKTTLILATVLGSSLVYFLLQLWEKKMRATANRLIKDKIEESYGKDSHDRSQIETYQQQIEILKQDFNEKHLAYEHEIDLLHTSMMKSKETLDELYQEIDTKNEELRTITFRYGDVKQEYHRLLEDYQQLENQSKEQLQHKESLLSEYQQTISEQRVIIEKKQRYIAKLEVKVRDLMYEIRSLLQLEEPPSSNPFSSTPFIEILDQSDDLHSSYLSAPTKERTHHFDHALQLQRYIEIAHNFTGVDHLGYVGGKSPRFLGFSTDSYAIDLRRLFDSFRDETSGIIFIYSLKEDKFLFVNNFIKNVLGWSPEKFIKDFPKLIEMGFEEWKYTLSRLISIKESQSQLVIRSKRGEELLFQCFMGMVSQGPFAHHIIGLLAPVD